MILSIENWFLLFIAFVWIIGAVLQDLKRREVDNIWNFSLIFIALSYRAFYSIYSSEYWFILNGLIGFVIFIIIGNILYYSRVFAGGDAKLLMALGTILPLSYDWIINFKVFIFYILLFMVTGSIYVLIWAIVLISKNYENFKREFIKQWKKNRILFYICVLIVILWIIFVIIIQQTSLIIVSLVVLFFPFLFVFAKACEEACMIKELPVSKVTEGDWLYHDVIVNRHKIKANWEGVSKEELDLLRKYYKKPIVIKQGIPFTPSFLFALIIIIIFEIKGIFKVF